MVRLGKTPSQLIEHLYSQVGAHYYDRIDSRFAPEQREATRQRILDFNPPTIGGLGVTGLDTTDGFKFGLTDGGWLPDPLLGHRADPAHLLRDDREGTRQADPGGRPADHGLESRNARRYACPPGHEPVRRRPRCGHRASAASTGWGDRQRWDRPGVQPAGGAPGGRARPGLCGGGRAPALCQKAGRCGTGEPCGSWHCSPRSWRSGRSASTFTGTWRRAMCSSVPSRPSLPGPGNWASRSIIHDRDAHEEVLASSRTGRRDMKASPLAGRLGVLHTFSGDLAMAERRDRDGLLPLDLGAGDVRE